MSNYVINVSEVCTQQTQLRPAEVILVMKLNVATG
jgi:hypothetical protein